METSKPHAEHANRWLRQQPIAHRGLHDEQLPENSLGAFQAAVARGYAIELDVRTTRDGTPVVFHDASLDRMTGHSALLHETKLEQLGPLQLKASRESIPTLEQTLSLVDGQSPLLIELKSRRPVGKLESAVAGLLDTYKGPAAIQSFDPKSVAWFRKHRPKVTRGQLSGDFRGQRMPWFQKAALARMVFNFQTAPDFIAYDHRCLPGPLVRNAGIPLLAWTVTTPVEAARAKKHADNIIFEGFHP